VEITRSFICISGTLCGIFAGKQNDFQGTGNKIDGNWKSGIPFIDQARLGPQNIPESRKVKEITVLFFCP